MIVLFSEPLPATDERTNEPILVQGVTTEAALVLRANGELRWVALDSFNVDFRYDYRTNKWVNVSWMGEVDDDEADDWSQSVPGSISDPDGAGDGDQSDEADHDPRDLDASEGSVG